jgi:hypothetical protein
MWQSFKAAERDFTFYMLVFFDDRKSYRRQMIGAATAAKVARCCFRHEHAFELRFWLDPEKD